MPLGAALAGALLILRWQVASPAPNARIKDAPARWASGPHEGKEIRLHPDGPVETAILQRLEEVVFGDALGLRQVSNRPSHLEDSVMGARTKMQVLHGVLEQGMGRGRNLAELAHLFGLHAGIQCGPQTVAKSRGLSCTNLLNPCPDRGRTLFGRR